jgi:multidrug resistance efflux pump
MVVKVFAVNNQWVRAGDLLFQLTSVDPKTMEAKDLIVQMEVKEENAGEIKTGQVFRLFSKMYSQRLHGHAEGLIEKIDPQAYLNDQGERVFQAEGKVTQSPFPLPLGSSATVEILVGKKQIYKIILEQ